MIKKKLIMIALSASLFGTSGLAKEYKTGDAEVGIIDNECDQFIERSYYSLCYDNETNTARWSIQRSSNNKIDTTKADRYNSQEDFDKINFLREDTEIPEKYRLSVAEYKNSYWSTVNKGNKDALAGSFLSIPRYWMTHLKKESLEIVAEDAMKISNTIFSPHQSAVEKYWNNGIKPEDGWRRGELFIISGQFFMHDTAYGRGDGMMFYGFSEDKQFPPNAWITSRKSTSKWSRFDENTPNKKRKATQGLYRIFFDSTGKVKAYMTTPYALEHYRLKKEAVYLDIITVEKIRKLGTYVYQLTDNDEPDAIPVKFGGLNKRLYKPHEIFEVPIEEIEKITGIKFLTNIKNMNIKGKNYKSSNELHQTEMKRMWKATGKYPGGYHALTYMSALVNDKRLVKYRGEDLREEDRKAYAKRNK